MSVLMEQTKEISQVMDETESLQQLTPEQILTVIAEILITEPQET